MANNKRMPLDEALQVILAADDDNPFRMMLEWMAQQALEHEMTEHLGAESYERSDERLGYRNGHRERVFTTQVGDLNLLIPLDRDGTFSTVLFQRFQRSEKALTLSLMEMYVQGVSTRKVKEITEKLCGKSFSSQLVSKLAGELDEMLTEWRTRHLAGQAYPYLFADATYQKVRENGRVVSKGILMVMGTNWDGRREILSVEIADTENATTWSEVFRDLKERGVSGVICVTSDDHQGIKAAVSRYFQGASWQRCHFHFMQNVLPLAPKGLRRSLRTALRAVFDSGDLQEAQGLARQVIDRWEGIKPAIADRIEDGIDDCLACFHFPQAHRKRIRTSNMLEWLNGELRRRTRVVRIFPNQASALRLISALAMERSEEWETGRRYLDMGKLEDWVDPERKGDVPWLKSDSEEAPEDTGPFDKVPGAPSEAGKA